MLLPAA